MATSKKPVKVPVILQMEALECGAASLAMILAYYGKWVPLEDVRSECGVSRDGSNALNIAKAAKKYGLEYKAYRYSVKSLREKATFPAIIFWNYNHFVVLNGFRGKYAYINDPAYVLRSQQARGLSRTVKRPVHSTSCVRVLRVMSRL